MKKPTLFLVYKNLFVVFQLQKLPKVTFQYFKYKTYTNKCKQYRRKTK